MQSTSKKNRRVDLPVSAAGYELQQQHEALRQGMKSVLFKHVDFRGIGLSVPYQPEVEGQRIVRTLKYTALRCIPIGGSDRRFPVLALGQGHVAFRRVPVGETQPFSDKEFDLWPVASAGRAFLSPLMGETRYVIKHGGDVRRLEHGDHSYLFVGGRPRLRFLRSLQAQVAVGRVGSNQPLVHFAEPLEAGQADILYAENGIVGQLNPDNQGHILELGLEMFTRLIESAATRRLPGMLNVQAGEESLMTLGSNLPGPRLRNIVPVGPSSSALDAHEQILDALCANPSEEYINDLRLSVGMTNEESLQSIESYMGSGIVNAHFNLLEEKCPTFSRDGENFVAVPTDWGLGGDQPQLCWDLQEMLPYHVPALGAIVLPILSIPNWENLQVRWGDLDIDLTPAWLQQDSEEESIDEQPADAVNEPVLAS